MFNFKYNERKGKMKKVKILSVALALTIVAAVIIACTKEKETKVTQKSSELVTVSKEDDMSVYLNQFKEKMQSSTKGDETLTMEDARWHLEAVLNYTYGDVGHQISCIQCDTFYYKLPTDGGRVSLDRLNEAFNSLSMDVENAFAACVLPDKSILDIQTRFENESRDGIVTVQTIMDVRGWIASILPSPFGPDDYWFENDWSGKCGPYVGECIGTGSVQALESKINSNLPLVKCYQGSGYFTDIDSIAIYDDYILEHLQDSLGPYGYRIHYKGGPTWQYPTCLSPDDLNYYLVEALKLVNELKPVGKEIIRVTNVYEQYVPIGYYLGFHLYTFKYGKFNCNGGGDWR